MAFDLSTIETDKDSEEKGVWTEDLGNGLQLLVARINNPSYTRAVGKYVKSKKDAFGSFDIDDEGINDDIIKIYAKSILLGWKGLEENGKELVYSEDEAIRIMTKYTDFFNLVRSKSTDIELFRKRSIEEQSGK